jgi:hypothetical protein
MEVMLTTHLAEYLCHIQPLQVRARLFRDESFRERLGLSKRSFITLWGMTIDTQELFTAARRAFLSKEDQILTALEGGVMKVTADDTCLLVNPLNGNEQVLEYRFNELLILSTCGEMRKHALDNLLQSLGPTSSDFSLIREKIGTCELNDDEVSRLLDEIGGGVTALQKRAAWAIEGGRFTLDDLVPSSMDYFERFCGPDPGHIEPEIYLSSLLRHWFSLMGILIPL